MSASTKRLSMEARARLFDAVWRDHLLPALHHQQNLPDKNAQLMASVEKPTRLQNELISDDAAD